MDSSDLTNSTGSIDSADSADSSDSIDSIDIQIYEIAELFDICQDLIEPILSQIDSNDLMRLLLAGKFVYDIAEPKILTKLIKNTGRYKYITHMIKCYKIIRPDIIDFVLNNPSLLELCDTSSIGLNDAVPILLTHSAMIGDINTMIYIMTAYQKHISSDIEFELIYDCYSRFPDDIGKNFVSAITIFLHHGSSQSNGQNLPN